MGFIERLRQEQTAKALYQQQMRAQEEAKEMEKQRRYAVEIERHAQRKQQAEKFREESKVGDVVEELGNFLATPTLSVVRTNPDNAYTELIGRGSSSGSESAGGLPISQKDPDSVFDVARWDNVCNGSKTNAYGYDTHFSEKYAVVESCPDGTIMFHGGWGGSTTIRITEWRTNDREQIFDKALKKAYNHPIIHRYSVFHKSAGPGFG